MGKFRSQAETVQLYSQTQVSGTLYIWASNIVLLKIIGFWKLPRNPKIFGLQIEGLFIRPSKKIKEFGAIFFKITLEGKKRSRGQVKVLIFLCVAIQHIWASNFVFLKIIGFGSFCLRIQKYSGYGWKGYLLNPQKKIKEFSAILFQNHSRR